MTTRMTIFVGADDRWRRGSLVDEIMRRARERGLAGATVLHGIEGFGVHQRVHTDRILSLAEGLPVAVVILDEDAVIREFLGELDELIVEGLVVLDPVEVVTLGGSKGDDR